VMESGSAMRELGEECAICGSASAHRSVKTQQFAYRENGEDILLVADIPVISCGACGEVYTAEGAEEAQHDAVCRYLKRLTPGEIRALRQRLGMSQAKFAEAARIGVASIKRWESGSLIQNASLDVRLRLLEKDLSIRQTAQLTPRFRTEFRQETLEAAKRFRLRPELGAYAEAA
jgi:putative zinc finger/helix-turn-helix YgiT family protein